MVRSLAPSKMSHSPPYLPVAAYINVKVSIDAKIRLTLQSLQVFPTTKLVHLRASWFANSHLHYLIMCACNVSLARSLLRKTRSNFHF